MTNLSVKHGFAALALASISALALTGTPASARWNRHVEVVNDTSDYMVAFHASRVGARTWEEDILGSRKLAPGNSVNVNIDDGSGSCQFDLRAEFAGGGHAERYNVDVCKVETWTVY